jgi:hypothetical protein
LAPLYFISVFPKEAKKGKDYRAKYKIPANLSSQELKRSLHDYQ